MPKKAQRSIRDHRLRLWFTSVSSSVSLPTVSVDGLGSFLRRFATVVPIASPVFFVLPRRLNSLFPRVIFEVNALCLKPVFRLFPADVMKVTPPMKRLLIFSVFSYLLMSVKPVWADVIILTNRTPQPMECTVTAGKHQQALHLEPGDLRPLFVRQQVALTYGKTPQHKYTLQPNTVHFFAKTEGEIRLHEIGLLASSKTPSLQSPRLQEIPLEAPIHEITVKLLVDDKDPATQTVWEKRLRQRLQAASEVMEKQCRVRFKVVAVEVWTSKDKPRASVPKQTIPLEEVLIDFEQKVKTEPAQLVIGFTSNRWIESTDISLNGMRGPLQTHLLLREWIPPTETERLEVLLHELGHFLGAAHSPEPDSIMRPSLGDGLQLARQSRLTFDPLNALAMNLVVEDLRENRIRSARELRPITKTHLHGIYLTLQKTLPDDLVIKRLASLFENVAATSGSTKIVPLVTSTRSVLAALVRAAEANRRKTIRGDALTEYYVQSAAEAAQQVPADQQVAAFLLALAVSLDDSTLLRDHPLTAELWRQIETPPERQRRLAALGEPTMRARRDWTQHFFISAALTTLAGPTMAETAGLFKEMQDAKPGGSGFSFGDLGADFAGIAFAQRLIAAKSSFLPHLQKNFRVDDYLPSLADLPEGLSQKAFAAQFGSITDPRFRAEKELILDRIRNLPPYRMEGPKP
jgi:hypothetical protein